jgi:lipopolysaccharide/colanic/teichoic acid biosynthesis glycosyltransferase
MVVIALAIWIEDRRPTLFTQTRVGKRNKNFVIFKFRTMFHDSGRFQGDFIGTPLEDRPSFQFQTTVKNDTRITKAGKFIRSVHLDELPQLINVIKGDMSLVGVRPDVPIQELEYLPKHWLERHSLRPGISGLAQISSNIESMEERTKLDLVWVNNFSIKLYFYIIFKTLLKVLKRNSL